MLKVMLVVGALVVAAGCSGGGGSEGDDAKDPLDGDGRDAYVAAFGVSAAPLTDEVAEERECVAGAVVDGVGVEELRDVATPREIADAATGEGQALAGLGVEVGDEQAEAIFGGVKECGDLGAMLVRGMSDVGGAELVGPVMDCFTSKLDDEILREIVITRLVEGDAGFVDKPEITAKLMEIGRSCATGT